jgi:alcohol dehydrogenase class IV
MTADYFHGSAKIARRGLFFVAAPTTAGTGSEVTANAVLSDKKNMAKKSIRGDYLIPDIAIVDPELTFSCPASLAADSGMDAIVQAVESLVSPESNAPSRSLALKAVGLLVSHLECAVAGDRPAKIAVAEGSLLSGMSFSQTGLGAVHGLAHPIGIKYGIPHGRICGILMQSVFRMNLAKIPGLYDEAAKACGFKVSAEFLDGLERLCDATGIPANFAGFGLCREDFPFILKNCRSRSMERNPCPFSDGEIEEMLEKGK